MTSTYYAQEIPEWLTDYVTLELAPSCDLEEGDEAVVAPQPTT